MLRKIGALVLKGLILVFGAIFGILYKYIFAPVGHFFAGRCDENINCVQLFPFVPLLDFYIHNRISKEYAGSNELWKKAGDVSFIFAVMKITVYISAMLVEPIFK